MNEITEQVLNDLKKANDSVVNSDGTRLITAMDVLLALSTVNINSFDKVIKYVEYNKRTINPQKWFELCDKAGI